MLIRFHICTILRLTPTSSPPLSKVRCCRPKKFGRLPEGLPHQPFQNRTIPSLFAMLTSVCADTLSHPHHPSPHTNILASLVKGEVLSPEKIRATTGGIAAPPSLAPHQPFQKPTLSLSLFVGEWACVKSNMVYTLCKHMVYMLSITNEHKNELEMRAKPEWKVHFLCFASAKRGSFSIR